jgi:ABC-2 type transport system ATP-binding protein
MVAAATQTENRARAGEELPHSPAIYTADLRKQYGAITALAGLSMTVPRGEIFGFLGPNGAGKTTSVKLLLGLTAPTGGEAWVLGEPVGDRLTRRRIGYLPELFRYQEWMTAREVLSLHCDLAALPRGERRGDIARVLDTVGLTERADTRVGTFSKGMQQRLGLAVALLGHPDLVFLDEPTTALDPVGRHHVREIIRDLKGHGTTVFLNSHLLNEVEQVCDRVAVIDRGRVIAIGTLDELRAGEQAVSLRAGGMTEDALRVARRFGTLDADGDRYTIRGMSADDVPALVEDLVRLKVRIYAVEPATSTLEDRFLQLLGDTHDDHSDDRPPDLA